MATTRRHLRLSLDEFRELQDRSDLREYFRRLLFHFPDLMHDLSSLRADHLFLTKICRQLLAFCAVLSIIGVILLMPLGLVLAVEHGMWGLSVPLFVVAGSVLWATYTYFRRATEHANYSREIRTAEHVYRAEHWIAQRASERNGHPANIPDEELEWLWENIESLREWRAARGDTAAAACDARLRSHRAPNLYPGS